ncbi:MAG: hypothetical protein HC774_01175 [Sphingomonadales bacterium]|nr:hypothetical protein [Sphingomonadales bacterium]
MMDIEASVTKTRVNLPFDVSRQSFRFVAPLPELVLAIAFGLIALILANLFDFAFASPPVARLNSPA